MPEIGISAMTRFLCYVFLFLFTGITEWMILFLIGQVVFFFVWLPRGGSIFKTKSSAICFSSRGVPQVAHVTHLNHTSHDRQAQ